MDDFLMVARALGDENRLRALCALRDRELCVCQLIELLGLAPSTVSKHMSILKQAGLVRARKEGRWHYYRLVGVKADPVAKKALRWMASSLAEDKAIKKDLRRIKTISRLKLQEACAKT